MVLPEPYFSLSDSRDTSCAIRFFSEPVPQLRDSWDGVTANRDDTDFHHAKPQILHEQLTYTSICKSFLPAIVKSFKNAFFIDPFFFTLTSLFSFKNLSKKSVKITLDKLECKYECLFLLLSTFIGFINASSYIVFK